RAGRELADPAGADEQDAAAVELAEHLLRERGGGGRHRRRALADRGLRTDALAELERLPEDTVEEGAGARRVEGGSNLAEDLALAGDERVEPGRNAKEVNGRRVVVHPVGDRLERLTGQLLERAQRGPLVLAGDVHLRPVAGREAHGVAERARERRRPVERERHALAQLDRRDVVRDADEREPQKWLPARATRATITSTNPARARWAPVRPAGRSPRKTA